MIHTEEGWQKSSPHKKETRMKALRWRLKSFKGKKANKPGRIFLLYSIYFWLSLRKMHWVTRFTPRSYVLKITFVVSRTSRKKCCNKTSKLGRKLWSWHKKKLLKKRYIWSDSLILTFFKLSRNILLKGSLAKFLIQPHGRLLTRG